MNKKITFFMWKLTWCFTDLKAPIRQFTIVQWYKFATLFFRCWCERAVTVNASSLCFHINVLWFSTLWSCILSKFSWPFHKNTSFNSQNLIWQIWSLQGFKCVFSANGVIIIWWKVSSYLFCSVSMLLSAKYSIHFTFLCPDHWHK